MSHFEGTDHGDGPREPAPEVPQLTAGYRLAIVGRLAAMSHSAAAALLRQGGISVVDINDPSTEILVLGEWDFSWTDSPNLQQLLARAGTPARDKEPRILTESELWQSLGLLDEATATRRWFTPAMLADLIGVPASVVRRWYRQGLLRAARVVYRLPYFDYAEAAAARRLTLLREEGFSLDAITRRVRDLLTLVPAVERSLSQITVVAVGRRILLRRGTALVDPTGQLHFDFEMEPEAQAPESDDAPAIVSLPAHILDPSATPPPEPASTLLARAEACDEEGRLAEAVENYRAAIVAGGLSAEVCFQLADVLYRLGDLSGARERFWMAVELDDGFVEARVNLGAVLTELGEFELAAAAFQGAIDLLPEYPDAHYLLAKLLRGMGRDEEALHHWREFVRLAPHSPWVEASDWGESTEQAAYRDWTDPADH